MHMHTDMNYLNMPMVRQILLTVTIAHMTRANEVRDKMSELAAERTVLV